MKNTIYLLLLTVCVLHTSSSALGAAHTRSREVADFGLMFLHGEGVAADIIKARTCFEWQIRCGRNPVARAKSLFSLGQSYILGGEGVLQDVEKGMRYWEMAALQTDCKKTQAMAHLALGESNYLGDLGKVDNEKALYHFQQAAQIKDDAWSYVYANLRLGLMFQYGQSGSIDYTKARFHLKKAADQDEFVELKFEALFIVGEIYLIGLDVPKKCAKARDCFLGCAHQDKNKSARADACWRLGELFFVGDSKVAADFEVAIEYLNKASEQTDNLRAQRAARATLGIHYAASKKGAEYREKALELLTWVINQHGEYDFDQRALVRAARILLERGKGNDWMTAKQYLLKAATQNAYENAAHEARRLLKRHRLISDY